MSAPRLLSASRKVTFTLTFLLLLSVFFAGYYFYFIPVNRENLHKNGFLILRNIQSNIRDRNEDMQKLYQSFLTRGGAHGAADIQGLLDTNNVAGKVIRTGRVSPLYKKYHPDSASYESADSGLHLAVIDKGSLVYLPGPGGGDSIAIILPVESMLKPVLLPQQAELFESYLLCSKKEGIIYKDDDLPVAPHAITDSLLQRKEAVFEGIKDVQIGQVDYKMFYYPFPLGGEEVILCAFVPAKVYNAKLHRIPVSFIYPIAILFLLLIIFLPLIKFYVMGRDEQMRFLDLTLSTISLFAGMTLLTLIIIQVALLWAADLRAKSNLQNLSAQIDSSFSGELLAAYSQLDSLDNYLSRDSTALRQMKLDKDSNVSLLIKRYFTEHAGATGNYYNFDRVTWVDSSGQQRYKGQTDALDPIFTNVSSRHYYQVFKQDHPYLMPGHPDWTFGFEPVNSWTNGEFRIIISKRSHFDHSFIASLSTNMYSVTNTVLPPGFGFCIMDAEGNVLLHSEMGRNLQENILEKIEPSRDIREAITSRQRTVYSSLDFYGRTNTASIGPIARTPAFLLTYYDKGYIVPINMRILLFSVLFCLLAYFVYACIWFLFIRKRYYSYPLLYSPLIFLEWAIPKRSATRFYVHGILFLLVYTGMLLFSIYFSSLKEIGNVILVLAMVSPVNVIVSLFVIRHFTHKHKDAAHARRRSKQVFGIIMLHLVMSGGIYGWAYYASYRIDFYFFLIQCLLNGALWFYYLFRSMLAGAPPRSTEKYLGRYAQFITLIIITLAVMPAALYTFYAHNQELIQSVKKEQLYLAETLEKRKPLSGAFVKRLQPLSPPFDYYNFLQYREGIYTLFSDSLTWKPVTSRTDKRYEQFYFTIANYIGNNYYDPLLYPSLQDSVENGAWYWLYSGSKVIFRYAMHPDAAMDPIIGQPARKLHITSEMPPRYEIIGLRLKGILLLLFVLCMVQGLYFLVRSLTNRIFLEKYLQAIGPQMASSAVPGPETTTEPDAGKNPASLYEYYVPGDNAENTYRQEKDMLDAIDAHRAEYDSLWSKFSDKEKYLLFDFARDGLVNFKNTEEIYRLIETRILILDDEEIKLFSPVFRAYILTLRSTSEMYELHKNFQQNSTWQAFRMPLLIVLLAVATFVFFTQEETFQKIIAMAAGLTSVSSMMLKFFADSGSKGDAGKEAAGK